MQLWYVDDKSENHTMWWNSFTDAIQEACELRSYYSTTELLDELERGTQPDILFVDFFVGNRLGTEIIRWFETQTARPVLIAHSSMERANVGMVAAGADFHLEKIKGKPFTESIRQTFQSLEDVVYVAQNRRIPT